MDSGALTVGRGNFLRLMILPKIGVLSSLSLVDDALIERRRKIETKFESRFWMFKR